MMINMTKQNMVFSLSFLAILAMGIVPLNSYAEGQTCNRNGCAYDFYVSYTKPSFPTPTYIAVSNPEPFISSIAPSSSNVGFGAKTITIIGEGFVPRSVARINGTNRPTTFIDSSHLLMQVTGDDTYFFQSNGGFYITVWSGGPGGGYSNAAFFTITSGATAEDTNNMNDTRTNFTDMNSQNNNLASNAIFGSNSVFSSLIQWIFYGVLILIIVILVRKIFGGENKYLATPLKQD
jgi:hypothetical protein